ncbi:PQQ-dependent sugar dehydrogenase, partial [Pontibacter pamirensis]|uniref:PQQ-dependent sugar dehydrogenase n=1 Tax=Pontibacter pamirensis TaxID=2562824 RepID=UPI0037420BC9
MRQQGNTGFGFQPGRFNYSVLRRCAQLLMAFTMPVILSGCHLFEDDDNIDLPVVQVPAGFKVEKVVGGLQLPTSVTWDDAGNMFVVEAGGGLEPEKLAPLRIMQVKNGKATVAVDLSGKGINPAIVGIVWHDGAFYITHRGEDLTGSVSRVTKDGQVETILSGIIDSQAEHQINDIRMGPDGRMYVAVGLAGNAGVMGPSVAPWIMRSPNVHSTPCQDIVLRGRNFKSANFLTADPNDSVLTGAFVPFGVATEPGEVIKGVKLCGGSILSFNPTDPMGT